MRSFFFFGRDPLAYVAFGLRQAANPNVDAFSLLVESSPLDECGLMCPLFLPLVPRVFPPFCDVITTMIPLLSPCSPQNSWPLATVECRFPHRNDLFPKFFCFATDKPLASFWLSGGLQLMIVFTSVCDQS